MSFNYYSNSIAHHGVKGQRWGVRRYQNEDGSLTNRGKQKKDKKELTPEQKATRKLGCFRRYCTRHDGSL